MRQRIIELHLNYLRIDHDETQLFWRKPEEHTGDQRVDTNTLATASRTGHQEMWHLCQIGDDGFAINVLTECERNFRLCLRRIPIGRLQKFA